MDEVGRLLDASALPPLPPSIPLSNVLVALEGGSVIAVVALEVAARRGLAPWVAVSAAHQAKGLGMSIVRSLIARAQELGLRELYAVARHASNVFLELGFSNISHGAVPAEIKSMRAYPDQCDDSTEIMRLELETRI